MTPCSLEEDWRFGTCCLHIWYAAKMEETSLSETSINFHQTARRHTTQMYSWYHRSPFLTEYVIKAKNIAGLEIHYSGYWWPSWVGWGRNGRPVSVITSWLQQGHSSGGRLTMRPTFILDAQLLIGKAATVFPCPPHAQYNRDKLPSQGSLQ